MDERFIFIDCGHTGISGDLLLTSLGSIIGLDLVKDYLNQILSNNSHITSYSLEFATKLSHGIAGIHLELNLNDGSDYNSHHIQPPEENEESNHELHDHYDIDDFKEDLNNALSLYEFSDNAKEFAFNVMNEIMTAEAEIHNVPLEEVHLHEIGAVDTIIDIAGVTFCLQNLNVFDLEHPTHIYFSEIAVGGGTITFSHGTLPVPAPATQKILERKQLRYSLGPVEVELATPTGVSFLAVFKEKLNGMQQKPPGIFYTTKIGIGVGSKELDGYSNILKTLDGISTNISNPTNTSDKNIIRELINVLETNIDDVRGELLGNLLPILMSKGAFDVSIIPCTAKKDRPGYLIKVISAPETTEELIHSIIEETGTLGVRVSTEIRVCLQRDVSTQEIELEGQQFEIHIKRAYGSDGNILQQKIEFDDLKKISQTLKIPIRLIEMKIWSLIQLN